MRLFGLCKKFKLYFVTIGLITIVKSFLVVAIAEVFRRMVDAAVQASEKLLFESLFLAIIVLAVTIVINFAEVYLSTLLQNRSLTNFQQQMIKKIFTIRMDKMVLNSTSEWITILHSSSGVALSSINQRLILIIGDVLQISVLFLYLSGLNGKLLLGSIGITLLIPLLMVPLSNLLRRSYDRQINLRVERDSIILDSLQGGEVVRSFSIFAFMLQRFKDKYKQLMKVTKKVVWYETIISTSNYLVPTFCILFILTYGGFLVSTEVLTAGSVIAFLIGMERIIGPISGLAQLWSQFQESISHGNRIFTVMDMQEENTINALESNKRNLIAHKELDASIVLNEVCFKYHDEQKNILHNVSLTLPRRGITVVVGPSGSGKSTLLKLVNRILDPTSGELTYFGVPSASIDLVNLRHKIAYVPQRNYIFSMSIFENIRLENETYSYEQVVEAAKAAGVHDFIMTLELGYDTIVNEGGNNLSGGERQKIGLARALLISPEYVLLDEPTSEVDKEHEQLIDQTLQEIANDKSVIVVTHRLNLVEQADQILFMEKGEIVESGSHEELLLRKEKYYELYLGL